MGIKGRIHNINLRIPCDYRQKLKKSGLDFKESERNMEFRKMVTVTLCYETAKETLMYRTVLWTLWERERVRRFGRMALKHVKYHV